ncbi:MAG: hypothetical protein ACLQM6_12030 [Acidobacteriaceae bacterium]
MPEIWENPFANAILKIERANKHVADIEQRLRMSSDRYGASLHIDSKTGEQFLYYIPADDSLRSDIALTVGDAVHNLHSALDIAWRETVRRTSPSGFHATRTKFPICKTRHELESTLVKTVKLDPKSAPYLFLVTRVKPYERGDADIYALHALDIDDKHHLLIPMVTVAGIEGLELENEDGTIDRLDIPITRPDFYRKTVRYGAHLKDNGELVFQVKFRQGTPMEGLEVIPTLHRFSAKVEEIVLVLRRMQ